MAGADAGSVISMKILVEENQIFPVRIRLKFLSAPVGRSAPVGTPQKNVGEATGDLSGNLPQVHHPPRARGEFDFIFVPQIVVKLLKRFNNKKIEREPDGATPV